MILTPWHHHKSGGTYSVVGVGVHPDTGEAIVYYVRHADGSRWWRPKSEFVDGRFDPDLSERVLTPEGMGFQRG